MRVLFAHGFEGSPGGSKPNYMREELGWDVTAPNMSELGWNIEQETEVLLRLIDSNEYDIIAGSSMGGLAAANASALRPDANFSLLLIAPAFGLDNLWRSGAGKIRLACWRILGSAPYFHQGLQKKIRLPWNFIKTADKMSWPEIAHPTVILHGTQDDIVPIESSRKMVRENSNVLELLEIDDGHRMQEAKPHFAAAADKLLGKNQSNQT